MIIDIEMKPCYEIILRILAVISVSGVSVMEIDACTGISLSAKDGSRVIARTAEWTKEPLQCGYVVSPRGYVHRYCSDSGNNGLDFKSIYGYVGIFAEEESFVVEGVNEAGLSVGLFFIPDSVQSVPYGEIHYSNITICDMQLVSWILSQFSSIEQVQDVMSKIDLVPVYSNIGSLHWRISEPDGRMVVLEYNNGIPCFYENDLGVLTGSPDFQWHILNLDNYVNLKTGNVPDHLIAEGVELKSVSGGSGMTGLPGDFTTPSRFVRAAFLQTSSPVRDNGIETVIQAFHILNNFDMPVGILTSADYMDVSLPSATQFTTAIDLAALKFYYRTAWNSNIRCIDLMSIDFSKVRYQCHPLDRKRAQPIEVLKVK